MKLCLGTVQFGMDYGVNHQKKPDLKEAIKLLDYAVDHGIDTIDTANAYGDAEQVVGQFIKQTSVDRNNFRLFSKLKPNILDNVPQEQWIEVIKNNLTDSLKRLNTEYLDGYLLHSSRYIFNDEIVNILEKFKKEGLVKKIGVSIYEQAEGERALKNPLVDAIQLPFSIFDQRLLKGRFLESINSIEVFSRSAFLQGLILMDEDKVPVYLEKAKSIIKKINQICVKENINRVDLAINFVKQQKNIDYLVFGIDNLEQLKEDIQYFENDSIDKELLQNIAKEFDDLETEIVMPSLWAKG